VRNGLSAHFRATAVLDDQAADMFLDHAPGRQVGELVVISAPKQLFLEASFCRLTSLALDNSMAALADPHRTVRGQEDAPVEFGLLTRSSNTAERPDCIRLSAVAAPM
jgi:hypothetical protein